MCQSIFLSVCRYVDIIEVTSPFIAIQLRGGNLWAWHHKHAMLTEALLNTHLMRAWKIRPRLKFSISPKNFIPTGISGARLKKTSLASRAWKNQARPESLNFFNPLALWALDGSCGCTCNRPFLLGDELLRSRPLLEHHSQQKQQAHLLPLGYHVQDRHLWHHGFQKGGGFLKAWRTTTTSPKCGSVLLMAISVTRWVCTYATHRHT